MLRHISECNYLQTICSKIICSLYVSVLAGMCEQSPSVFAGSAVPYYAQQYNTPLQPPMSSVEVVSRPRCLNDVVAANS